MRSVVTGGGGFLGSYLVKELLERGDEVVVLARGAYPELTRLGARVVRGDVRDGVLVDRVLQGTDRIFHVAARVGIWGRWREYYETNVLGTENVIRSALKHRVSRLIYTSSPSVVFDGSEQRGIDESYPYPSKWLSPYPRSKKLAEERVLAANGKEGLYTVALRPHLIWGKGDKFLIPRILEQGRKGRLVQVGEGKNRVDIIHVRNAARAHVAAAERLGPDARCAGRAYFLSQGEPVALWDFIHQLLERAKLPPVRRRMALSTAYRLGAGLELVHRLVAPGREPRMTRFLALQLAHDHYYNIEAARRDLGYEPTVTTEQGLREMFS